jgi:N-acetylglucosamine-6-sulfatase
MAMGMWLYAAAPASQPNIVYFLTDDQDQMLGGSFPEIGGVGPMPQTKALMAQTGSTSTHFHIHTPICNPSRSALLSGKYFHNIKTTGGGNIWTMHVDEDKVNAATFAKPLRDAGYTVGLFGKYMNVMPKTVPPGFDAWMANSGGTYIAPSFMTHGIESFTGIEDGHWEGTSANYTTASVGNVSVAWIESVVAAPKPKPFFAYVAPKAAHEPFNPAPWYVDHWDRAWPAHEPRPVSWNASGAARSNHAGVVETMPMLTKDAAAVITDVFKNRWRTLMSVDDVIASVVATCKTLGVHEQTYYLYSSDHGFQLGEFNIPMDKRVRSRFLLLAAQFRNPAAARHSLSICFVSLFYRYTHSRSPPLPPPTDHCRRSTSTTGTQRFTSLRRDQASRRTRSSRTRLRKSTSPPPSSDLPGSRSPLITTGNRSSLF